jgi:release factor glutamine methyltransferase
VTEKSSRVPLLQTLKHASQILAAAGCDSSRLDAEVLLAHILGRDRAWLYANPEGALSPSQLGAYQTLVSRRAQREPVAYLTGHKEFYGLDFAVTSDVLVPRPETEHLVQRAINWGLAISSSPTIADVGTGSGAIGVTLAAHLPGARIIAIDTSYSALAVARCNAVRHGVANRVSCLQGDLLVPLRGTVDLVVANPPYLSGPELAVAPPEVSRWEPRAALDGGSDGLSVIRRLLPMASSRLRRGGALFVEIGADQGTEVINLARHHFPQADAEIARDYAERDRLLVVHDVRRT